MEKSEEAYLDGASPASISTTRSQDLEGAYLARTNSGEALNPQPSNDPEDPLNWPLSLKASTCRFCGTVKEALTIARLAS
jgi:hypothetical protein